METRHRARVVIADDHMLLAEACKKLLEPEFEVIAVVNNGRALLETGAKYHPDIALVDIGMPRLNGLDAGEELRRLVPSIKLVFLTMNLDAQVAAEAFRRGASAYIVKNSASLELLTAIREVLKGRSYLSPLITEETVHALLRKGARPEPDRRITARQREVLQLLAEGMSMKEIASVLNVRPGTVAFHKYRAMEILGLRTNSELIKYALTQHVA
jgi:DNA-binding NarL/FixJ family response regulator